MNGIRAQGQKKTPAKPPLTTPRSHLLFKARRVRGYQQDPVGLQGDSRGRTENGRNTGNRSPHTHLVCFPAQGQAEGGAHTQTPWQLAWASSPTDLQRDPLLPPAFSVAPGPTYWSYLNFWMKEFV